MGDVMDQKISVQAVIVCDVQYLTELDWRLSQLRAVLPQGTLDYAMPLNTRNPVVIILDKTMIDQTLRIRNVMT
jgi:hypothetical protein